jgi:hypothetical protein
MVTASKIRVWLFRVGLAFAVVSVCIYLASWFRPVRTTGYLEQARQAIPWIDAGLASAFLAFVFCFFGRRIARLASVGASLLMFLFWILIAGSNF